MIGLRIRNARGRIDGRIGKIIGVVGTSQGCGSTYVGLLIANVLKKVRDSKVAYIHMSGNYTTLHSSGDELEDRIYVYKGIIYYARGGIEDVLEALNDSYDHIIIDFGNGQLKYMKELMRCDIKVVVGLATSWKLQCFEEFLTDNEEVISKGKWRYVFNLTSDAVTKKLRGRYKIRAVNIGYEECFYSVENDNFKRIIALLEG